MSLARRRTKGKLHDNLRSRSVTGDVGVVTPEMTADEALSRLAVQDDYDPGDGPKPCVHTFVDAGFALLGAHWSLADVRVLLERNGAEEADESAQAMQHGVVTWRDDGKPLFLETRAAT